MASGMPAVPLAHPYCIGCPPLIAQSSNITYLRLVVSNFVLWLLSARLRAFACCNDLLASGSIPRDPQQRRFKARQPHTAGDQTQNRVVINAGSTVYVRELEQCHWSRPPSSLPALCFLETQTESTYQKHIQDILLHSLAGAATTADQVHACAHAFWHHTVRVVSVPHSERQQSFLDHDCPCLHRPCRAQP
jgi:hypothetical protein